MFFWRLSCCRMHQWWKRKWVQECFTGLCSCKSLPPLLGLWHYWTNRTQLGPLTSKQWTWRLLTVKDNTWISLQETPSGLSSIFSDSLLHLSCVKEHDCRSFVPAAIKLHNLHHKDTRATNSITVPTTPCCPLKWSGMEQTLLDEFKILSASVFFSFKNLSISGIYKKKVWTCKCESSINVYRWGQNHYMNRSKVWTEITTYVVSLCYCDFLLVQNLSNVSHFFTSIQLYFC